MDLSEFWINYKKPSLAKYDAYLKNGEGIKNTGISTEYFIEALYACIEEKDIVKAKQSFYTSAKIKLYQAMKFDKKSRYGWFTILAALLSDDQDLIKKYGKIGIGYECDTSKGSISYSLELMILGEMNKLNEQVKLFNKYKSFHKNIGGWLNYHVEFIKAFIGSDLQSIIRILNDLESDKFINQRKRQLSSEAEYISFPTTAYAKLAWMRGMEVKVDSPYVPQELLPVRPNEVYYDEYEFLKELDSEQGPSSPTAVQIPYEEVGPYPDKNPELRSDFVNRLTVRKVIDHFCPGHQEAEKEKLADFIWEAYTDPEHFDLKHADWVRPRHSSQVTTTEGRRVLEARPFWSEYKVYDDEGFFYFCNHFIIMEEMGVEPEEVNEYLDKLKTEGHSKGGFFGKLFT